MVKMELGLPLSAEKRSYGFSPYDSRRAVAKSGVS